jgi:hypothetical protein
MSVQTPLLFNASGPVATPPAVLNANLIALVQTLAPGYTVLPAGLIEDLSSTATGALVTIDQARVDAVNNVTPYGANAFTLSQLGLMLGVPQGVGSNGSAYVVISGSPGYVIAPGFIVSDGTNQYSIQDGGTVGSGGSTPSLFVVATNSGTFAIPEGTIDQVITSVPSPYTLTVTNPTAGIAATSEQTVESYRAQVIQAENVSISGTMTYLKTLLELVPGVSPQLVSVLQQGSTWEVICGGGDPYQTAGAIFQSGINIGLLTGSQISSSRNVSATIYDPPNSYNIIFINPPQQVVGVTATWNTTLINYTAQTAVNQYMSEAGASYINSITVGQPINLLVMQEQIQAAISSVLLPVNLTTLTFAVTINSVPVSPTAGTSIIPSDIESYFYCSPTGFVSVQG